MPEARFRYLVTMFTLCSIKHCMMKTSENISSSERWSIPLEPERDRRGWGTAKYKSMDSIEISNARNQKTQGISPDNGAFHNAQSSVLGSNSGIPWTYSYPRWTHERDLRNSSPPASHDRSRTSSPFVLAPLLLFLNFIYNVSQI